MKVVIRPLSALGDDIVLAPERWLAVDDATGGVPLGDLVVERRERVDASAAIVLDTTHAKDGLLDIAAAVRAGAAPKSAKKLARSGDLIVSRLRPYLRQIALIHPGALAIVGGERPLAVSTEFHVLAPRDAGDDLGFLLPFLLGERAQAILAAAQEGGHHPRVPRSSLLALRVPDALVRQRRKLSAKVESVLTVLYGALADYQALLDAAR